MQTQILEAPEGAIGPEQREFIRQRFARGEVHDPREVGRLIAAVVLSELNGAILNLDGELGRELVQELRLQD